MEIAENRKVLLKFTLPGPTNYYVLPIVSYGASKIFANGGVGIMTYVVDEQNIWLNYLWWLKAMAQPTARLSQKTAIFGPSKWNTSEFDGILAQNIEMWWLSSSQVVYKGWPNLVSFSTTPNKSRGSQLSVEGQTSSFLVWSTVGPPKP